MGGWTRIWVVLTVLVGAVAAVNYMDNVRNAKRQANDAYQQALDSYDGCRNQPSQPMPTPQSAQPRPGDTGPVSDLVPTIEAALASACDYAKQPKDQYAKQQAQQRDAAIAKAKGDAAISAASAVAWASGTVGALFIAVGWVWRGFRRKNR